MALKFKNSADVKWMLYLSDTKLNMLYEQMAVPSKERRSFEWNLTVKIASLSRKSEHEGTLDRDEMLKHVVKEIEASGRVGTVDEPNEFIRGILPMRWGGIDDWGRPSGEAPLVYFGALTEETVFGLGGSMKHVIGMAAMGNTGSRSLTPFLIRHLVNGLELAPEEWHVDGHYDTDNYEACQAIAYATHMLGKQAPECHMEFFAKTLLVDRVSHPIITGGKLMRCLLGTPLFVAMSGQPPEDAMRNF